jgi:hypothetical protein
MSSFRGSWLDLRQIAADEIVPPKQSAGPKPRRPSLSTRLIRRLDGLGLRRFRRCAPLGLSGCLLALTAAGELLLEFQLFVRRHRSRLDGNSSTGR